VVTEELVAGLMDYVEVTAVAETEHKATVLLVGSQWALEL
jgi:hypothetical protein